MQELWADIPNYIGLYQVSNLGRAKSLYRKIIRADGVLTSKKEVFLKHSIHKGYYQVVFSINNKTKAFKIHQLVAMAFLNHIPNGYKKVVDHINNIKTDNRLCNIQIITQRENASKDRKNKTSKYTGVHWDKKAKKWRVSIKIEKENFYIGYFDEEDKAYLAYMDSLNNYINFNLTPEKKVFTSKHKGVSWNTNLNKWRSKITINKEEIHLGYFETETEAYENYVKALENYKNNKTIPKRRNIKKSSKYKGVSFKKQSKSWVAIVKINGKPKQIGSYNTEYDAFIGYNKYINENEHKL